MVETYTVQNAMGTGKKTKPFENGKQASEYYVKFVESEQTFPVWFIDAPNVGTKIEGTINGSKFEKAKKPQATAGTPTSAPNSRGRYDSDGQRQGMCINNAANYVSEHSTAIVAPETWAKTVYEYANALYLLGDLGKEPAPAESTGELFGGTNDQQ
jgi:hypothetical protein